MEDPNKNQTASVLSLVLFNWLNETVRKASRVPHLPLDDLPVLADSYTTKNLVKESFPVRTISWCRSVASYISTCTTACGPIPAW